MKCCLHTKINSYCKHGDILSKNNKLYHIIGDGEKATILHTQTQLQINNYIYLRTFKMGQNT